MTGGVITGLYPFSFAPTPHEIDIAGQTRYAMCAIDALGMPAMLDRELTIATQCAVCATPIAIRARPGEVLSATPATALVVARGDETEPASLTCCPYTVFLCDHPHAEEFQNQVPGTVLLPMEDAQAHGEGIFAGLLGDTLPAARPRGGDFRRLPPQQA